MRSVTVRGPELDPALFIQQVNGMLMVLTAGGTVNPDHPGRAGHQAPACGRQAQATPGVDGDADRQGRDYQEHRAGKVRYQNGGFVVPVVVLPNRIYEFRGL